MAVDVSTVRSMSTIVSIVDSGNRVELGSLITIADEDRTGKTLAALWSLINDGRLTINADLTVVKTPEGLVRSWALSPVS